MDTTFSKFVLGIPVGITTNRPKNNKKTAEPIPIATIVLTDIFFFHFAPPFYNSIDFTAAPFLIFIK